MAWQITKSYSKKTKDELENSGGLTNYISWDRMKEYIAIASGIKENEQLDGIIVDDDGIKARISIKTKDK